jgi:hypothetical protein
MKLDPVEPQQKLTLIYTSTSSCQTPQPIQGAVMLTGAEMFNNTDAQQQTAAADDHASAWLTSTLSCRLTYLRLSIAAASKLWLRLVASGMINAAFTSAVYLPSALQRCQHVHVAVLCQWLRTHTVWSSLR